MRAITILCLLSTIYCGNIISIGLCLIQNPKLISIVKEIFPLILEKKWTSIASILMKNLYEIKVIVAECIK